MDSTTHRISFGILLALVTFAFGWLLLPYYGAVLWAVILAIIFQPMQKFLQLRLGQRRNLAALICTLVCFFIAIIPVSLIVASLISQGAQLYNQMETRQFDLSTFVTELRAALPPSVEDWIRNLGVGDFDALREKLTSAFMQGSQLLASQAVSVGQNTLHFVISTGIMLYLLFFFFRDGRSIGRNILSCLPLSDKHNRALLGKFTAVLRATVKGNIIIAAIQGLIGGIAFWAVGIEAALFAGVLMAFLSMLPAIGAALVWAPVAAYFLLTGEVAKGVTLIVVGVGVIGLVDNLLRPPLVGKDTRLPDYVVLVSTVGGMSLMGINGFVLGPLIAALFMAAWTLFRAEEDGPGQPPAI